MALRVLPYVTLDVDDHLRRRVRLIGDRLRVNLRSYLLSAADDVDTAGERVRGLCDAAVHRVDSVVTRVNDKIDPSGDAGPRPRAARSTRSSLTTTSTVEATGLSPNR